MNKIERMLSEIYSSNNFISFGYCRNGIVLLLSLLNLKEGAEIIIPAFTCSVIPSSIKKAGCTPVPVDSGKDSLNISPEEIKKHITDKTAGIYVVHAFGVPADIEGIASIANDNGLFLFEDIAHSLISGYQGRLLGEWGDFVVVSLTKQLVNSGGGLIGIKDNKIYKDALEKRDTYYSKDMSNLFEMVIYKAQRFFGSFWNSRSSFICLFIMKLLEFVINNLLGKQVFDDDIKPYYYKICGIESWFACIELKRLQRRTIFFEDDYKLFCYKFRNIILPNSRGYSNLSYWGGTFSPDAKRNLKYRLLEFFSFRTWMDYHQPGKYPNAQNLFKSVRIFSKIIRYF